MRQLVLFSLLLLGTLISKAQPDSSNEHSIKQKLINKADSALNVSDTALAKASYSSVLNSYKNGLTIDEGNLCGYAALKLSKIYFGEGNYNLSLDASIKGIKIIESTDYNADLLSNLYLNAGNIYSVFEDHEKGFIYYNEGLEYVRQTKNVELESFFLNNLTAMCCYTKDIPQAKVYNNMAKELPLKDTIKQLYYYSLNNGFITLAEDKLQQAILHYKTSIEYALKPGMSPKFLAASYSEIYKIYEETNELDSAIYYLEKYRVLSEKEQYTYMQVDSYKTLSRLYNKTNQRDKALSYQEKYVLLADSMMNNREFNRIRSKQSAYEKDKSNSYINELTTTISEQKLILTIIISFLIILITLSVLLLIQKRKLQGAYHDIFERNKELINIEEKYLKANKIILGLKEHGRDIEDQNKTTGLKEEQRNALLHKINHIMETSSYYCNPDFSLAELANLVQSNTKYVSQIINETYNVNFRTFINEYRIKLSRKRLIDTQNYGNYTIKAIAESVGFKSQSNFILSFKKTTGITPSLYQNMAQKEKK
ncbi:helix-turn-helix transcriptional regulator [Carboxylicivirga linearis]|uniref:Helix-turn-helix transcriptional regulator n=1 Tax=Carboxylicivirga linearis TaxID=1628157 RepID=A0ABS5JXP3_9BACT|nr:helix-turn-helix transcriptional regulator [Carboxylicivirga linearis]MBS2099692.1 helix-turn-helix transcriptional regulator [Carboxylicivirga linearis]